MLRTKKKKKYISFCIFVMVIAPSYVKAHDRQKVYTFGLCPGPLNGSKGWGAVPRELARRETWPRGDYRTVHLPQNHCTFLSPSSLSRNPPPPRAPHSHLIRDSPAAYVYAPYAADNHSQFKSTILPLYISTSYSNFSLLAFPQLLRDLHILLLFWDSSLFSLVVVAGVYYSGGRLILSKLNFRCADGSNINYCRYEKIAFF